MNKRTICLYFPVHQPISLRQYHFFDIGLNHDYYDDFNNATQIRLLAEKSYLPMNLMLLNIIEKYGKKFKVAFSLSGTVIEQFKEYAPEVLESFKKLADTGCVEFVAEPYSYSLSSLENKKEFLYQVKEDVRIIKKEFGILPKTFCNTELIYSDEIGKMVAEMGYTTMITEGAKHVMGWKSSNFVYANAINPKLRLLLRNFVLSDDIGLHFANKEWSEWPLTAEKYIQWIDDNSKNDDVINICMDYKTFGYNNSKETGIFEFMKKFMEDVLESSNFEFMTPNETALKHQPKAALHIPYVISWTDEERDINIWLGNELQKEAFDELYKIRDKVFETKDTAIIHDFTVLQESDNFYYMSTKIFSYENNYKRTIPYDSPYEAFINYMNVLSDLIERVKSFKNKK